MRKSTLLQLLIVTVIFAFSFQVEAADKKIVPLTNKALRNVLQDRVRLADKIQEIIEERCCEALDNYGNGTATIEEVNTACHEAWDENSVQDQMSMMVKKYLCDVNELSERDEMMKSVNENFRP